MTDYRYRGYRISTRSARDHHANIWRPTGRLALAEIPTSTREEGETVLVQRAHEVIDQDIISIELAGKNGD